MGKRYYCDYCDKSMVSSTSMIRTHNNGLVHQKLVNEHYNQYKDPETILSEESKKKPCSRFSSGTCQFGSLCRFSHYTPDQIHELRMYVAEKKSKSENTTEPSFNDLYNRLQQEKTDKDTVDEDVTILYDPSGLTHTLPWSYNSNFDSFENLPPSLRRMKMEDFNAADICANLIKDKPELTFVILLVDHEATREHDECNCVETSSKITKTAMLLTNSASPNDEGLLKTINDLHSNALIVLYKPTNVNLSRDIEDNNKIWRRQYTFTPPPKLSPKERAIAKKKAALHPQPHLAKFEKLLNESKRHFNFYFREAKRIDKTGIVLDDLRKMIIHLENMTPSNLKELILRKYREIATGFSYTIPDVHKTNKLSLHYLKDFANDGFE